MKNETSEGKHTLLLSGGGTPRTGLWIHVRGTLIRSLVGWLVGNGGTKGGGGPETRTAHTQARARASAERTTTAIAHQGVPFSILPPNSPFPEEVVVCRKDDLHRNKGDDHNRAQAHLPFQ